MNHSAACGPLCLHSEEFAPGEFLVVMICNGEPVKVSLRKDED